MQSVHVKFNNYTTRVYGYKVPGSWDCQIGDKLIVDSPSDGYVVVTVTQVFDHIIASAKKRAVDKINVKGYQDYCAKQFKREQLEAAVKARVEEVKKKFEVKMLAAQDNELAELLKQLESVSE